MESAKTALSTEKRAGKVSKEFGRKGSSDDREAELFIIRYDYASTD